MRICWIRLSPRAGSIERLRYLAEMTDRQWPLAPASDADSEAPADDAVFDAAEWLAEQVGEAAVLDALVLDAAAGVCAWLSSPTRDLAAVGAMARAGAPNSAESAGGAGESARALAPITFYAPSPSDSTIQPLSAPLANARSRAGEPVTSERLAVIAQADAPVRALIDALDRRGIEVRRVLSVWHAMAQALDVTPDEPGAARNVVADQPTTTALVLVDREGRGRWAWSSAGVLIAAGSMRVALRRGSDGPGTPRLSSADAARLTSDWLAWSVQTGRAPARVVCLAPGAEPGDLGLEEFGRSLAQAWPDGAVEVVPTSDPWETLLTRVRVALSRAASTGRRGAPGAGVGALARSGAVRPDADPGRRLIDLTRRPVRAHRRFYVWAALAIALGALVLGVFAFSLRRDARAVAAEAQRVNTEWRAKVGEAYPLAAVTRTAELVPTLQSEVGKLERALKPAEADRPQPILDELETLSLILASNDIELRDCTLSPSAVTIQISAADVAQGELFQTALNAISGSHVASWTNRAQERRINDTTRVDFTFVGVWAKEPARGKDGT